MKAVEALALEGIKRRHSAETAEWFERFWTTPKHVVTFGPGAALLGIASELRMGGIGCGCNRFAAQMNAWGIQGCLTNWDTLAAGLSELAVKAKALPDPPEWFNPADAAGSIIQQALWRAENETLPDLRPEFVTTERLVSDTYKLVAKLPPDLAGIVGISRSGILPANLLCQHLHLPMWILRQDSSKAQPKEWGAGDVIACGNGWRLSDHRPKPGPVVVIDDTQMTGRSIRRARPITEAWAAERDVELLWAVVYQNPLVSPKDKAEIIARELPRPHFLEWNLFNGPHVERCAFDIDGILCDEQPKREELGPHGRPPLYPVRKKAMKLLVTGRHERHRASTLAWLAKWGMKCDRLEMLPDGVEHGPGIVSAHKAAHFAASKLLWFVESCPIQAREIAKLTGKPVICPAAAKVY